MIACFIGGGDHNGPQLEKVYQALSQYVSPQDKVLVIPFAAESDKYDRWLGAVSKPFQQIGLTHIKLLDYNETTQKMIGEIQSSQVLFLTGGKPDVLMHRLQQKQLAEVMKRFDGVLIGYSAGALAMCKDCIITKDDDYPETTVIDGLGISDFSVEVHYKPAIDEDLLPYSGNRKIYALPDGSAVIWDGTNVNPVNRVIEMSRMVKTELE